MSQADEQHEDLPIDADAEPDPSLPGAGRDPGQPWVLVFVLAAMGLPVIAALLLALGGC